MAVVALGLVVVVLDIRAAEARKLKESSESLGATLDSSRLFRLFGDSGILFTPISKRLFEDDDDDECKNPNSRSEEGDAAFVSSNNVP